MGILFIQQITNVVNWTLFQIKDRLLSYNISELKRAKQNRSNCIRFQSDSFLSNFPGARLGLVDFLNLESLEEILEYLGAQSNKEIYET